MDANIVLLAISILKNRGDNEKIYHVEKFDEIITKRGYSSRSEGIRDAIRSYIRYYAWMNEVEGERAGTISIVYDHNQRGLVNSLL